MIKMKQITKDKERNILSVSEYDQNGNEIHYKNSNGYEEWYEYDQNWNEIHYKDSDGIEYWKDYDDKGRLIYYKTSNGYEEFYEYIIYNEDTSEENI